MKAIIIGAGVIGLSTAYFLRRDGADVTILERREGPGLETSFANGSLLTPSMPEPWNAPGVQRELFRLRQRERSAMLLRVRSIPSLFTWGTRFLLNATPARFDRNTAKNARLAKYSLDNTVLLCEQERIDCDLKITGSLRLFRDANALARAVPRAARLQQWGIRSIALDPRETIEREPQLLPIEANIAGALHYPDDATGDALKYCRAMAGILKKKGAELKFASPVTGWNTYSDRITSLRTPSGDIGADTFVLAAASASTTLGRLIGIAIPVRPAKGYSITTKLQSNRPILPVIDDDLHAAAVPIGENLRVAGTAEFAGFDISIPSARIDNLVHLLSKIYPKLAAVPRESFLSWAGLRPMSADGVPIIGCTRYRNLFLATGHGPLGWTMAVGSGKALAERVLGSEPAIDLHDYRLERF